MLTYLLTVIDKETKLAIERLTVTTASAAMESISGLLEQHPGCERITVHAGAMYLFSVNCKGETIPD
jgi:hypothetical protein